MRKFYLIPEKVYENLSNSCKKSDEGDPKKEIISNDNLDMNIKLDAINGFIKMIQSLKHAQMSKKDEAIQTSNEIISKNEIHDGDDMLSHTFPDKYQNISKDDSTINSSDDDLQDFSTPNKYLTNINENISLDKSNDILLHLVKHNIVSIDDDEIISLKRGSKISKKDFKRIITRKNGKIYPHLNFFEDVFEFIPDEYIFNQNLKQYFSRGAGVNLLKYHWIEYS